MEKARIWYPMTPQQEPEYRITKSELKEYARLKAHENSADFAPLSKVHELSEKYESEIRARGSIQQCSYWGIARTHHEDGDKNEWCCVRQPENCPQTCVYKRFSTNMRNAAEHDAAIAAKAREDRNAETISRITTILMADDPDAVYAELDEWKKSLRSEVKKK